jgi:hypothetical protein
VTDPAPSLPQQIEAVEWAALHLDRKRKLDARVLRASEVNDLKRKLEAAAETLGMLEFGRGVLK